MKTFKPDICLIGAGEMGGVFARGILKIGHPVYPVGRGMNIPDAAQAIPSPEAVIVAVGEKDLPGVLQSVPDVWRGKLVLLQNELLPRDWQTHRISNPTVISVWFEKKYPSDFKPIIPSPVFGPAAELIKTALESLKIPCRILNNDDELLFELVLKNVYILTTNIAGLTTGGTVGELWSKHEAFARAVADDIMDLQFFLIGKKLDREQLIQGMLKAFEGDPQHKCMGRSAPARLQRALQLSEEAGLPAKTLRTIHAG